MSEQRDLIFRLINDGQVVGYEWHRLKGLPTAIVHSIDGIYWTVMQDYIKHDQKDQYIGQRDVDGCRIFENDKIQVCFFDDDFNPSDEKNRKIAKVYFNEIRLQFDIERTADNNFTLVDWKESKVIGNIYDGGNV